jgi:Rhodopirellula transposase DDE domain
MRKGEHELQQGMVCIDAFSLRGRKRSEDHLPNVLVDITAIVDGQSQTDPQFRSTRLDTRLTATEVRRQLMVQFGYRDDALPTAETISTKLNELGYSLNKGAKTHPQKNSPKRTPSSSN